MVILGAFITHRELLTVTILENRIVHSWVSCFSVTSTDIFLIKLVQLESFGNIRHSVYHSNLRVILLENSLTGIKVSCQKIFFLIRTEYYPTNGVKQKKTVEYIVMCE